MRASSAARPLSTSPPASRRTARVDPPPPRPRAARCRRHRRLNPVARAHAPRPAPSPNTPLERRRGRGGGVQSVALRPSRRADPRSAAAEREASSRGAAASPPPPPPPPPPPRRVEAAAQPASSCVARAPPPASVSRAAPSGSRVGSPAGSPARANPAASRGSGERSPPLARSRRPASRFRGFLRGARRRRTRRRVPPARARQAYRVGCPLREAVHEQELLVGLVPVADLQLLAGRGHRRERTPARSWLRQSADVAIAAGEVFPRRGSAPQHMALGFAQLWLAKLFRAR